jgi:hypothetical protein
MFHPDGFVGDNSLDNGGGRLLVRNDIDFPITIIDKVIGDACRRGAGMVVTCPRRPDRKPHPVVR